IVARHAAVPLRPIRESRAEVPAAAAAAIEQALAKRPGQRQRDARELADALRAPGGWDESTTEVTPGPRRRRRGIAFTVAAAAIGVAGFLLIRPPPHAAGAPVEIVVLPLAGDTLAPAGSPRAHDLFAELIDWMPGFHAAESGNVLAAGGAWGDLPVAELLARTRRAGGRYLVTGSVTQGGPGPRVTIDLFSAHSAERLVHPP